MKNYYDELEVSKTASKEVIEKVYKVLAKKYHPDTTKEENKQAAEEKFKIISEAYEVLSDDEKREKYDLELEQSNPTISYEEYINVVNQRDSLNNALNDLKNKFNNSNNINQQYYDNNNHIPYNRVDSNLNNSSNVYNNVNNYQNINQNYANQNINTNSKKKTYYYTNTGKPASALDYFKYKIKEFISNIGILLLAIVAAILIFNTFSDFNLFALFIK